MPAGGSAEAASVANAASQARFFVRAIQVKGNTILSPAVVEDIVYPFMGPDKTPDDIEAARAALQKAFETKGYATVSVFIPEQSVDSGVIRLEVQPQTIGTVEVAGGKRTSRDWVMARAPSLRPGATPNFTEVQRDVVALNGSADRKVTPEVKAGVAPGTVDVVLNVEDRTPFHASAEVNNYSSAATTKTRVSATLRYDDMWGRGDSLSVSAQTAPQRTEDGTVFSANYLSRLGRAQLLLYYVHSDSDIAVVGGTSVIGKGDLGGVRFILPLGQREGFYQSLTAGMDYKNFKENVQLGADRDSAPIEYLPFTIGWRGDWTGDKTKSNLSLTSVFGVRGLGDGLERFDYKRYGAKPNFFVMKGEAASTADIWGGLQLSMRATGQWSPDPLISNEGFSLGGMDTVRGYYESENLADWGIATQGELRSPELATVIGGPFKELRVLGFLDSGFGGIHRRLIGQDDSFWLASAGLGGRLKVFNLFSAAVDVGVPLRDGPDTDRADIFARFRIWGEF
ncbi:ShlB/FhaC/HecB family hemolysin secretion/activation protein [Sphingomonas sp. PB4P5]|uniref:ShlB/FhaC/HecB family hemolysin secretion/activation protein n=1 Tax=Parasphingomonas puruogangriensis TaxID=3096155 RepID=UPI002FC6C19B